MKSFWVAGIFLLLPSVVWGAGFAKQSLFLSQSSVTEGDTVLIHAVVSNDTSQKFVGSLDFTDNTVAIGNVPTTLLAGEAATLSISWKPSAGNHNVVAKLQDTNKNIIEENLANFTVASPTKATNTETPVTQIVTPVQPSTQIQQTIYSVSPAVANGTAPVFSAIDSGRTTAAHALDQGILWSKEQLAKAGNGKILGTETKIATSTQSGSSMHTVSTILATALLYILSILRYLLGNAGIFYPIVAFLFLLLLWMLYRRMRRPRY